MKTETDLDSFATPEINDRDIDSLPVLTGVTSPKTTVYIPPLSSGNGESDKKTTRVKLTPLPKQLRHLFFDFSHS